MNHGLAEHIDDFTVDASAVPMCPLTDPKLDCGWEPKSKSCYRFLHVSLQSYDFTLILKCSHLCKLLCYHYGAYMKPSNPDTRIASIAPFGLRMHPELKQQIEAQARANGRSLNAEIVWRLEQSLGSVKPVAGWVQAAKNSASASSTNERLSVLEAEVRALKASLKMKRE